MSTPYPSDELQADLEMLVGEAKKKGSHGEWTVAALFFVAKILIAILRQLERRS